MRNIQETLGDVVIKNWFITYYVFAISTPAMLCNTNHQGFAAPQLLEEQDGERNAANGFCTSF